MSEGEFGSLDEGSGEEPFPNVERRSFSSGRATINKYVFGPGAEFPLHRHRQEQITLIEEGEVEFWVAGSMHLMSAGDWCVVPPDVEHSLTATNHGAVVTAVVVPPRKASADYTIVGD